MAMWLVPRRNLTMPGLAITVGGMIEALRSVAGSKASDLIEHKTDPTIAGIVANWPRNFSADRAESLGFSSEKSFEAIIHAHVEDELDGKLP